MWRVEINKSAQKELAGLPVEIQRQVGGKLSTLKQGPFPPGHKKLKAGFGYRIRSGDYRVVYTVADQVIQIVAIRNRKDVYR